MGPKVRLRAADLSRALARARPGLAPPQLVDPPPHSLTTPPASPRTPQRGGSARPAPSGPPNGTAPATPEAIVDLLLTVHRLRKQVSEFTAPPPALEREIMQATAALQHSLSSAEAITPACEALRRRLGRGAAEDAETWEIASLLLDVSPSPEVDARCAAAGWDDASLQVAAEAFPGGAALPFSAHVLARCVVSQPETCQKLLSAGAAKARADTQKHAPGPRGPASPLPLVERTRLANPTSPLNPTSPAGPCPAGAGAGAHGRVHHSGAELLGPAAEHPSGALQPHVPRGDPRRVRQALRRGGVRRRRRRRRCVRDAPAPRGRRRRAGARSAGAPLPPPPGSLFPLSPLSRAR